MMVTLQLVKGRGRLIVHFLLSTVYPVLPFARNKAYTHTHAYTHTRAYTQKPVTVELLLSPATLFPPLFSLFLPLSLSLVTPHRLTTLDTAGRLNPRANPRPPA